jgi:prevent-host-death family protein
MVRKKQASVGVRELKAKLSSYLRRAQAGETIEVTDRGAVVAELRPHQPSPEEIDRRLDRMAKEGLIIPAKRKGPLRLPKLRGKPLKSGELQKILDEERADRF